MKHQDFSLYQGLPDAPLPMPKQTLERQRGSIFDLLRSMLLVWQRP
jgi:hypothetical protein